MTLVRMAGEVTSDQIFAILSDKSSVNLLGTAYESRLTSSSYVMMARLVENSFIPNLNAYATLG